MENSRSVTSYQNAIVNDAINGGGSPTEILARNGIDSVKRSSMETLRSEKWLNDEVINYFCKVCLANRDKKICDQQLGRRRSHFFSSFFVQSLFDEKSNDPNLRGHFNYNNVKLWSAKVPGGNIFNLKYIFCPINYDNQHWTLAVIYMEEKRIQYYDSLGNTKWGYLYGLLNYIFCESIEKKNSEIWQSIMGRQWTLVPCTGNTPRQRNGTDCGAFVCKFCDNISCDRGLEVVKQSQMNRHRRYIALSILTMDNEQAIIPRMQNELEDAGRSSSEAVIVEQATPQHCLKRSKLNTPNARQRPVNLKNNSQNHEYASPLSKCSGINIFSTPRHTSLFSAPKKIANKRNTSKVETGQQSLGDLTNNYHNQDYSSPIAIDNDNDYDSCSRQSPMARRTFQLSKKKEVNASSYSSEVEFNEEDSISSNNQNMAIRRNSKRSKPFTPGAIKYSVRKHLYRQQRNEKKSFDNRLEVASTAGKESSTTNDPLVQSADALICKPIDKSNDQNDKLQQDHIAYTILQARESASASSSDPIILYPPIGPGKIQIRKAFLALPTRRSRQDDSAIKSQKRHVSNSVKYMNNVLDHITPPGNESVSKDYKAEVIKKLAENHGLVVVDESSLRLDVEEVAALQRDTNMTTRALERLKTALGVLRPQLSGIIPGCIRIKLSNLLRRNAPEVECKTMSLIISSTDDTRALRHVSFPTQPIQTIQLMVEYGMANNKYVDSLQLSSLPNTCFITGNIDKGNGNIVASVSCRNILSGNSGDNCFCIGYVEGPVVENFSNIQDAFFKDNCPVGLFLHDLTDGSLCIITVTLRVTKKLRRFRKQMGNKEGRICRSIVVKSKSIPNRITMDSTSFANSSDVVYAPLSNGVPSIDLPADDLICRLVKNEDGIVTGAQLLHGSDCILFQEFVHPLDQIPNLDISSITPKVERIQGFPVCDMKMQLILLGIASASCTHGCPNCTSSRDQFKRMPPSLHAKILEKGGDTNTFKAWDESYQLRSGECDPKVCKKSFDELTGALIPTKDIAAYITYKSKSVSKDVTWSFLSILNNGAPMHLQCGINNHYFDSVRRWIKAFDTKYIDFARAKLDQLVDTLDSIQEFKTRVKDPANLEGNKAIKQRKGGLRKQANISKIIKQLLKLHDLKKDFMNGVDREANMAKYITRYTPVELAYSEAKVDEEIDKLEKKFDAIFAVMKIEDRTESKHNANLLKGTANFVKHLSAFTSTSNKIPQGEAEFTFETSLQQIGGGSYCPQHGGRDQTNGKAMISLENIDEIFDACIESYNETDERHAEFKEKVESFRVAGKALYKLNLSMKSQKKQNINEFEDRIADFIVALEEAVPGFTYYNKLHFLTNHATEFVRLFGCFGLLSDEGHESNHAVSTKRNALTKSQPSLVKSLHFFGGEALDLHEAFAGNLTFIKESKRRKARGSYNIKKKPSPIDISHAKFVNELEICEYEGKSYLKIPGDGGIIEVASQEDKELFLYSVYRIPPTSWGINKVWQNHVV